MYFRHFRTVAVFIIIGFTSAAALAEIIPESNELPALPDRYPLGSLSEPAQPVPPARQPKSEEAVVVTASRLEETPFKSDRAIPVADAIELMVDSPLSALDSLKDRIGIWIEKKTATTSDPVIRGVSGGNLLALIDGNSLTALWGEGGFATDDMYGKVDAESLERIEVVRGPSSVLYGSNALGGVINFITKRSPVDYQGSGEGRIDFKLKTAYASVSDYWLRHIEAYGASENLKFLFSGSIHTTSNIKTGGGEEAVPSHGLDKAFHGCVELKIDDKSELMISGQVVDRPTVVRFYRPTQTNSNERQGVNVTYRRDTDWLVADSIKVSAYRQFKRDKRFWSNGDEGVAWWETSAADFQAVLERPDSYSLTWGCHISRDIAESPDDEQFTMTTSALGTQKASPLTIWDNAGLYARSEWQASQSLRIAAGARFDTFFFDADDSVFYTIPGSTSANNVATTDEGSFSEQAVTGGLSITHTIRHGLSATLSWNRGYRLFPPSFGLRKLGYGVLAPNGLLDPVTTDHAEFLLKSDVADFLKSTVALYYADFRNFQSPIRGSWNGLTEYDFNGNSIIESDESIYVNAGNGRAFVRGLEIETDWSLKAAHPSLDGWTFGLGYMYNYGRQKFPDTASTWFRHTHPERILIKLKKELRLTNSTVWFEASADCVRRYDRIEPSRLTGDVGYRVDPQNTSSPLVRSYGLPGYSVFDLRSSWKRKDGLTLTAAVENVFDKLYRTAHSRMDAPGRNLQFSAELQF